MLRWKRYGGRPARLYGPPRRSALSWSAANTGIAGLHYKVTKLDDPDEGDREGRHYAQYTPWFWDAREGGYRPVADVYNRLKDAQAACERDLAARGERSRS